MFFRGIVCCLIEKLFHFNLFPRVCIGISEEHALKIFELHEYEDNELEKAIMA